MNLQLIIQAELIDATCDTERGYMLIVFEALDEQFVLQCRLDKLSLQYKKNPKRRYRSWTIDNLSSMLLADCYHTNAEAFEKFGAEACLTLFIKAIREKFGTRVLSEQKSKK
jgi:hypothetical protein